MRIVFFGTPDFAVASLNALVENSYDVVGVITAPDKPAGRGHKLQPSAVKSYALEQRLNVLQPTNLKAEDFITELESLRADIQIVVAFRMLPEIVWNMPKLGTFNVHGSLLPDYRGAAPINWAIINGEKSTGVTFFKLKHEIDTGSILNSKSTPIGEDETAGEVYARLMHEGASLLVDSLKMIESGSYTLKEQVLSSEPKHAPKIFKDDCEINWNQSAQNVHNFIRGMSPFPCAFTKVRIEEREEVWKISRSKKTDRPSASRICFIQDGNQLFAACDDFWLEILEIQTPGKRRLKTIEFLNGFKGDITNVQILKKPSEEGF
ncbi:MAG TPA: methionyl-tRNA formyltransferase [Flavobacteriales bacterium]|nr:methionyl-tRNA formyltransferase [Flavobacteriales bacterium]